MLKLDRLKSNYVYSVLYQLLIISLPIVTAPYVTRVLGVEMLGIYTFTFTIASYFTLFVILGMASYGNRSIAFTNTFNERQELFHELYSLQVTWGIFVILLYFIVVYLFGKNDNINFYIVQGLYVISGIFDVSWYFFGKEDFRTTVTRNILIKILSTISIFIFVKDVSDIFIYAILISGSMLLGNFILFSIAFKEVGFKYKSYKIYKSHIKRILIFFIPIISVGIYTSLSKILLGKISSIEDVTFYEFAMKIISAPLGMITALGAVMMPRMSNLYSNNKKETAAKILISTFDIVGIIAIPLAIGMIIISEDFAILFYGETFKVSGKVLSMLSFSIPFIAFGNVLRNQILIPLKMDNIFVVSVMLGAILSLLLNLILIPQFAAIGAAFVMVITEVVVCTYQLIRTRNYIPSKIVFKQIILTLMAAIIMGIGVIIIRMNLELNWMNLVASILFGIIIYVFLIIIVKDSVRKLFIDSFKNHSKI